MRTLQKLTTLLALAGLVAGLLGCAAEATEYLIKLKYTGGKTPLPRLSQASPTVAITPFVDLRREGDGFGVYKSFRQTVFLVPAKGSVTNALTEMAKIFFERAGFRHHKGSWDGEVSSLRRIRGDYAVMGEIQHLDFSGNATLNYQKNRGSVTLRVRIGNRADRRVVSRTIEVSSDKLDFRLLKNQLEHLMKLEIEIQKAVNKAIHESLAGLLLQVGS